MNDSEQKKGATILEKITKEKQKEKNGKRKDHQPRFTWLDHFFISSDRI